MTGWFFIVCPRCQSFIPTKGLLPLDRPTVQGVTRCPCKAVINVLYGFSRGELTILHVKDACSRRQGNWGHLLDPTLHRNQIN